MANRKSKGAVGAAVATTVTIAAIIFGTREQAPEVARFPRSAIYENSATRATSYQSAPAAKTGFGDPHSLKGAVRSMGRRLQHHSQTGYTIHYRGNTSAPRSLKLTLDRVRELAKRLPYDTAVLTVRAEQDGYRELFRKHDRDPTKIVNTEGTRAIDIAVGTTLWYFPTVRSIGIYVCRTIAGSSTLSQHAFANAWDLGGSTELLDKIARFQVDLIHKGWLPVSQVIWRGRELLSGHSVYDHYDHIHDSGAPLLNGGCRHAGSMPDTGTTTVESTPPEGEES